jgi:hypothetical protein
VPQHRANDLGLADYEGVDMAKPKARGHIMAENPAKMYKDDPVRRNNIVTYLVNNYQDHAAINDVALQIKEMMDMEVDVSYALVDYLIAKNNSEAINSFVRQIRELRREELKADRTNYVYFIGNQNQIKIGISIDPGARAVSLSLRESNVLGVIEAEPKLERILHERFAKHRIGNTEWFEDCSEIRDFIDEFAEPFGYKHRSRKNRQPTPIFVNEKQGYINLMNTIAGRP